MAKQTFDPASVLSDEEKAAIVNQRAKQWAAEAFSHQLNREALLAADDKADTSDIDDLEQQRHRAFPLHGHLNQDHFDTLLIPGSGKESFVLVLYEIQME